MLSRRTFEVWRLVTIKLQTKHAMFDTKLGHVFMWRVSAETQPTVSCRWLLSKNEKHLFLADSGLQDFRVGMKQKTKSTEIHTKFIDYSKWVAVCCYRMGVEITYRECESDNGTNDVNVQTRIFKNFIPPLIQINTDLANWNRQVLKHARPAHSGQRPQIYRKSYDGLVPAIFTEISRNDTFLWEF